MASSDDQLWWSAFELSSLPADCLAVVLSLCPSKVVCRLATVSRTWRTAAVSEEAWSKNLSWKSELGSHFPGIRSASSSIHLWRDLLKGLPSSDKSTLLIVDPTTGLPSFQFSAVEHFNIAWLNKQTQRYWKIKSGVPGSGFDTCAYLVSVCWFEVEGELKPKFHMPPGRYSLSWKVARDPATFAWDDPAKCTVTDAGGFKVMDEVPVDFNLRGHRYRSADAQEWGIPEASGGEAESSAAEETLAGESDRDAGGGDELERDSARAEEALAGAAALPELADSVTQISNALSSAAESLRHAFQENADHPAMGGIHIRVGPVLMVTPPGLQTEPAPPGEAGVGEEEASSGDATAEGSSQAGRIRIAPNWYRLMPQRPVKDGRGNRIEWQLYRVGEVEIGSSGKLDLHVRLFETESGWWRSGLYVDSLVLSKAC